MKVGFIHGGDHDAARQFLMTHLVLLSRQSVITVVAPEEADLVVVLLTAGIFGEPAALAALEAALVRKVRVLPVVISACDFSTLLPKRVPFNGTRDGVVPMLALSEPEQDRFGMLLALCLREFALNGVK